MMAFIVIILIISPFAMYVGALSAEYDINDTEVQDLKNVTLQYYSHVNQLNNESAGLEEDPDSYGVVTGLTEVTSVITNSVNFMQALLTALVSMMPVDVSWVLGPIIVMIILLIALAIANWLRGGGSPL